MTDVIPSDVSIIGQAKRRIIRKKLYNSCGAVPCYQNVLLVAPALLFIFQGYSAR